MLWCAVHIKKPVLYQLQSNLIQNGHRNIVFAAKMLASDATVLFHKFQRFVLVFTACTQWDSGFTVSVQLTQLALNSAKPCANPLNISLAIISACRCVIDRLPSVTGCTVAVTCPSPLDRKWGSCSRQLRYNLQYNVTFHHVTHWIKSLHSWSGNYCAIL